MKHFKDKTIIVTGGTGSIGSEIVRQLLASEAKQIRVFSHDEHALYELDQEIGSDNRLRFLTGDVRDRDRVIYAFKGADICFHAAALKHVPACEYNPYEAVKTNIIGTQNVIDASIENNLERVIAVSTDKAVSPESVMGASKLMMERLIRAANLTTGGARTIFSSVRFGNVTGSRGSVLNLWKKQIEQGGPVTVTHKDMKRFIMEVPEAVGLIFEAIQHMKGGEIFVLKMEKHLMTDYAQKVISESGADGDIEITFIGIRPGEKMDEVLFTEEEEASMLEMENIYIILPPHLLQDYSYPSDTYPSAKRYTRE